MSIPAVARYLYLQRGQEWRIYSDQPQVRGQCDRPALEATPNPTPFTLRVPPDNATSVHISARTWIGRALGWDIYVSKSPREITAYGISAGVGISAGAIWNRRDVLAAPILFPPMFVVWTRYSGSADSFAIFSEQTHGIAKAIRTMIPPGLLAIARRWGFLKIFTVLVAIVIGYWGVYKLAFGRKCIRHVDVPMHSDTTPPEASAQTTGTGVEAACHLSTDPTSIKDEEELETPVLPRADTRDADYPAQPCEASGVSTKGCSRQQLAGCAILEVEPDRFALLEDGRNLNHADQLSAYLCAQDGKEYATLINNKRCVRPA